MHTDTPQENSAIPKLKYFQEIKSALEFGLATWPSIYDYLNNPGRYHGAMDDSLTTKNNHKVYL